MKTQTTRWVIRMMAMTVAMTAATSPTGAAEPLGTSFTYQGQLKYGGVPLSEMCDFRFTLWNNAIGTLPTYQVGPTLTFDDQGITPPPIVVTSGLFSTDLDFGVDAFGGSPEVLDQRWLEIEVACPSGSALQPLSPRQAIRATPYALQTRGFYVDPDRKVGIGTTTPTNRLSVFGNANIMGYLGIGDQTPNTQLSVGNGGKFLVSGFDGDLTFTDDMGTIKFPPTDGTNSPMIQMFTSGFNNGDRMVIQHSQSWRHGLQFEDSTDRFHFINTGGERFMSIDLRQSKVGIGEEAPSAMLHIGGTPGVDGIMFPDGTLQTTAGGGGGLWTQSSSDIYYNSGNVGIGEVNPTALLHLGGTPGADGIMFPDGTLQTTAAVVGGGGDSWALSGNAGTTPGAHFVGTTDDKPLELHVGGVRALRIEPTGLSPNLIGGHQENMVNLDVDGATISGGGAGGAANRVTDAGGAIGGGMNNQAGDGAGTTIDAEDATVAGGYSNTASGLRSAVGGGRNNTASGTNSAVGGGFNNNASDSNSVVSGGGNNIASGNHGTVAGGARNTASGGLSAVGGGDHNTALGYLATVPGGSYNQASGTYSFAAGQRAHAIYEGSFVWSDSTTTAPDLFRSTGVDQFLINATGGVGINTNAPGAALHIGGEAGIDGLMFPDGTLQTTASAGGGSSLWSESADDIYYNTGDVGIGTSSPWARLHVIEPVGFAILGECVGEGTHGYLGHEHAGVFGEVDSPTGHASWFEGRGYYSGNLGLGVVSPSAKLHIGGTAGVDGIKFPDGTLQTTAAVGGGGVWSQSSSDIYYTAGKVGIGTSSPSHPIHVEGSGSDVIYAKTTATSIRTNAVRGDNNSIAGAGVSGEALASSGTAAGVQGGAQSPNGVGVLGYNDNDVAPSIGVRGVTGSPTGFGGYFEGRGYFSGNVGIGTTSPVSRLHIVGPDDPVTGAVLTLAADTPDRRESGRIRFGESTGNFRGAFLHYDGFANKLHLGMHSVANSDPADDINAITIRRNNGFVGIGRESISWPLHVGGDAFFEDRVGIGGLSTEAQLHVEGHTRVEGSIGIRTAPVAGIMLDMKGDSIFGMRSETTFAGGLAVIGNASATSGGGAGVLGSSSSPNGIGVRGNHTASTGTAAGVHGTTSAAEDFAAGVKGEATSTSDVRVTTGVTGISHAGFGIGVYGKAVHTGGALPTYGGLFESLATHGIGVGGVCNSDSGYAGYFVGRGYFSGNVGIGTANPTTKLDVAGWTRTEVLEITGGADLAEQFDVAAPGGQVEPGLVVVIDPDHPGKLILSDGVYDRKVAGVVSGAGGVKPGMLMGQRGTLADGKYPIALTGRVWTWCDASAGAIQPGDLLTTSSTPGHAMKVTDHTRAQGAVIGKAMTPLTEGAGLVLVLVSLQ